MKLFLPVVAQEVEPDVGGAGGVPQGGDRRPAHLGVSRLESGHEGVLQFGVPRGEGTVAVGVQPPHGRDADRVGLGRVGDDLDHDPRVPVREALRDDDPIRHGAGLQNFGELAPEHVGLTEF